MSAPTTTPAPTRPADGSGVVHQKPTSSQLVKQVAMREITTNLRDKAYLTSVAVFTLILIAVIVFNVVMSQGASEHKVAVVGNQQAFEDATASVAKQSGATVTFTEVPDRAAGEKLVRDGDADVLLDGTTLIAEDSVDSSLQAILEGANQQVGITENAAAAGLSPSDLASVMQVAPLSQESLSGTSQNFERGIIAIVGVGLGYMMLMTMLQFVAQGVVIEKSSRVVELLLTALKPRQLLAGKVLGLGVLGLAQMILVLGLGVAVALGTGLIEIPAAGWSTIIQVIIWFVLGYALLATTAAAAASLVSRQEDLGSAIMPLTVVPMVSFFLSFKVLNSPSDTLATIASMIPGLSPTTMPVRAAMTDVPIWQYAVAVILQLAAVYFMVRLAGRIYSGAMLKTSGKLKAKEALARSNEVDAAA